MSTLLLVIYIILTLYLSWRINKKFLPTASPVVLPFALVIKYGYAFFFLVIYTEYYGGGELTADAGRFFEESKTLFNVFQASPVDFFQFLFGLNDSPEFINTYLESTNHWNAGTQFILNDSRNVMRANAVLMFISNGSVYIHFIIFSFISFLGAFDLFQFVRKNSTIHSGVLLFVILLAPSIAFWSSSIIKEPLLMTGLFIFIRGVFDDLSIKKRSWRIVLGIILLIGFKPYVLVAVLVGVCFYIYAKYFYLKRWVQLSSFLILATIVLLLSGKMSTITHVISKKQEDFINVRDGGLYLDADEGHYYYIYYNNRNNFDIQGRKAVLKEPTGAKYMSIEDNFNRQPINLTNVGDTFNIAVQMSQAGSGFDITPIKDNFSTMLIMVPEVFFNTFVRPIPTQSKSWLAFPAFLENIIYLLGLVLALFIYPRKTTRRTNNFLWSFAIIGTLISLIVGWTTPVAGAIVRYIIPAQAMLLLIILIKLDWLRIVGKFKNLANSAL